MAGMPPGLLELCVSDNGSDDGTQAVIAGFAADGLSVRCTRLDENAGFSANFWSAARLASGKFVWITGDDDAFDGPGMNRLLTCLEKFDGDLAFINNAPWKASAKSLADKPVNGLEGYFEDLGLFHGSFIGNTVYRTASLLATPDTGRTMASAYPHMSPVLHLLQTGRCGFFNLKTVRIDDSSRSWRVRQPLLTAVDMARLVTDLAFTRTRCRLITRLGIYARLMRSLPRAIHRAGTLAIAIDPANPYQSLSLGNIIHCYRASHIAWPVACLAALGSRCWSLLGRGKSG